MIFLGSYKAATPVKYRANFHNDTGTLENPTSPEAQHESPAGAFTALTAPAIVNAKTGHFGGTVDTTGFASGQHFIRMAGTVTSGKVVATEFSFQIVGYDPADSAALGLSNLNDTITSRHPSGAAVASVVGSVGGSVAGDLAGKVLGGGVSVISATGARVVDAAGNNVAPAATALTNATWTDAKAAFLDAAISAVPVTVWDRLLAAVFATDSLGEGLSRFILYGFYQNGAVWVDTVNGTDAAVVGVNGTNRNECKTEANINDLLTALGLNNIEMANGSSLSFTTAQTNRDYRADGSSIGFGVAPGQNISNSVFRGAIISGVGTGSLPVFESCSFLATTLPALSRLRDCNIGGNITLGAASTYTLRHCGTATVGGAVPIFDFGILGATKLNLMNYTGPIEVQNMAAGDTLFFEGTGDITIDASCQDASVTIRGMIGFVNQGTNMTLDIDQRVTNNTIQAKILTDATPFPGADVPAIRTKTDLLPDGITKNAALNNFEFLLLDSTDHVTPKTGLTVTAERSIDGAAFGAAANAVAEVGSGIYKINLAASDLNGDVITFKFTALGADAAYITVKTQT